MIGQKHTRLFVNSLMYSTSVGWWFILNNTCRRSRPTLLPLKAWPLWISLATFQWRQGRNAQATRRRSPSRSGPEPIRSPMLWLVHACARARTTSIIPTGVPQTWRERQARTPLQRVKVVSIHSPLTDLNCYRETGR